MAEPDDNFFSRWSHRKVLVREGVPVAAVPQPIATAPAAAALAAMPVAATPLPSSPSDVAEVPTAPALPPAPTLADVTALTTQSDFTRFVAQGVAPDVKNAALKKLFTDPHFNVMDGLDIYIDDYGKPDPLPEGMLRKMVQSKMLRLFDDDPEEAQAAASLPAPPETLPAVSGPTVPQTAPAPDTVPDTAPPELSPPNEDIAVQLQPDAAAGRPGPDQGAGEDAGRQH